MSGDELSKHLGRQMSLHDEKYKGPEPDVDEVNQTVSFTDVSKQINFNLILLCTATRSNWLDNFRLFP